jgi:hypothetical protein
VRGRVLSAAGATHLGEVEQRHGMEF